MLAPATAAKDNGLKVEVALPEQPGTRAAAAEDGTRVSIGQTALVRYRSLALPARARAAARFRGARAQLAVEDGTLDIATGPAVDGRVLDAAVVGDVVCVLAGGRLMLSRPGMRPVALEAPGADALATWGSRLGVVSTTDGRVELYAVGRELPTRPYVSLAAPPGTAPVDRARQRARSLPDTVFSVHAGDDGWSRPTVVSGPADWYDSAVAVGRWIARLEPDGTVGAWRARSPVEASAPFTRRKAVRTGGHTPTQA